MSASAEIRRRDERAQVGRRQVRQQLILQLLLAIVLRRVREVARRIVAGAVLELQVGAFQAHLDAAEPAIARRVAAAVTEHVVCGRVVDDAVEDGAEGVRVEKRPASGVLRHRRQRVLSRSQTAELIPRRRAGERRGAAPAALRRIAAGHHRLQAAHVGRVDRDVGAVGAIDRAAQLDLVVGSLLAHAAAEVDHRLLLLDAGELVGQRLQRVEPPIGIEDVELGVVGGERVAVVRRVFGVAIPAILEAGRVDAAERIDRFAQLLAVRGEILDDLQRRGERRDRDEIGGRQFLVQVVVRRVHRALHFFRLHRAQVEEQHDEAAAVHVDLGGRRGVRGTPLGCRLGVGSRSVRAPRAISFCGTVRRRQDRPEAGASAAGEGLSSSSKSKLVTVCGLSSSEMLKSSRVRPRTTAPFLSRTTTLTRTSSVPERNTVAGCCGVCAAGATEKAATRRRNRRERKDRRETTIHFLRAQRSPRFLPCRGHQNLNLNSSCTCRIGLTDVTWPNVGELTYGVDGRELNRVEHVAGENLDRQAAGLAERDVLGQPQVHHRRPGTDDRVPAGVAERPRRRNREGRGVEEERRRGIADADRLRRCSWPAACR